MDLVQFLGRFHVLLLHLPIGILFMAAFIEIYWVYKKQPRNQLIKVVWLWGAISAAGAAFLGYLLSLDGGYNEEAIAVHRNWAISVIVCSFFCWFYLGRIAGQGKKIISFSVLQLFLLFSTGHYGANMTHGETYLVEHAPIFVQKMAGIKVREKVTSVEQAQIYPDVIEPMLMQRCSGCHNDSKAKGKLSLASYENTTKHAIVANNLSDSEIYKRITLDSHHDEFMPAEGKTPLTKQQIKLIAWWIGSGAQNEALVESLKPSSDIHRLLEQELKLGAYAEVEKVQVDELSEAVVVELEQAGFHVSRIQQNQAFIRVIYANLKETFDDKKLNVLLKAKAQIKWLKLAKSSVNDQQLATLSVLENLTQLDISNTAISHAGVIALDKLPRLKINTFNTLVKE